MLLPMRVAAETGEPITNLFDFADINRYEHRGDNQVTYLSRADWAGTWPKKPVKLSGCHRRHDE